MIPMSNFIVKNVKMIPSNITNALYDAQRQQKTQYQQVQNIISSNNPV